MRYVAIVEDENEAADRIKGYVDKFSGETGQDFVVERFCDAVDLIEGYKPKYRALSNPDKGSVVPITMHDPRMPGWLGWTKYQLSFPLSDGTSITIHYVGNRYFPSWLSPYFDFKFKN